MTSVVFVCALVLLVAVCQATHVIKGLYCRDPDTGKLYAVNSTWPSQTFCGNYTCKLRKKNTTETQYTPIQKINISDYIIQIPKNENNDDMSISPSEDFISVTKKIDDEKYPIFHKDIFKSKDKDVLFNDNPENNDRYLTESEIKVITDMLRTVKKSDLEAIVDIYNLAQDIYKEIDTGSTKNLVTETTEEDKLEQIEPYNHNDKQSYWYEPLHYHNKHDDLSHQGTTAISTKNPPSDANPTFFKGPLTEHNFGKLPYYYPISNFQRLSSYMHPKPNSVDLEDISKETKPCNKPSSHNYLAVPWYGGPAKKSETQARIQPSTLLPYPFSYVYHYNISGYPSSYYPQSSYYSSYYNPWAHTDYSRLKSYPQSYYGQYVSPYPSYSFIKADNHETKESSETKPAKGSLLDSLLKTPTDKKKLPDWQTEPLSEKVLEDIRAFVVDKPKPLKPFSLQKNIKLEKVGKVIKLDELTRERRDTRYKTMESNEDESTEYEVYVERTTCENSTEVGYFSYGNLTQPFPGCCPRKIDSLHTTRREIINDNN